ncbi:MAG: DMT family transporter [Bacteroidia bacterium]|jgi:transporter family-2 protein|nr:DMT family transporter [Bacteroidia bacterium]
MQNLFLLIIAVLAGAVLPLQAGLNSKMGQIVQSPVISSFISFVTGAAALLVYMLMARVPLANLANARTAPVFFWVAGLLGAFYVTSVIMLVPRLGTALTFGLIIGGQMLVSLAFDHFGLLGAPVQPLSFMRVLGVVLLVAGVVLIRKF